MELMLLKKGRQQAYLDWHSRSENHLEAEKSFPYSITLGHFMTNSVYAAR